MKLRLPKEERSGETRVAVTSDTVKKLRSKGLEILIEKSAGIDSRR
jgi:NAD/NADP transhydrogenase alpha subunit